MLLTDEENPYPREPREHIRGGVHTAFNQGAKAQLKNVLEWGEELCYDHNGEQRREQGWRVKRRECPICWQALLEEVSNG